MGQDCTRCFVYIIFNFHSRLRNTEEETEVQRYDLILVKSQKTAKLGYKYTFAFLYISHSFDGIFFYLQITSETILLSSFLHWILYFLKMKSTFFFFFYTEMNQTYCLILASTSTCQAIHTNLSPSKACVCRTELSFWSPSIPRNWDDNKNTQSPP